MDAQQFIDALQEKLEERALRGPHRLSYFYEIDPNRKMVIRNTQAQIDHVETYTWLVVPRRYVVFDPNDNTLKFIDRETDAIRLQLDNVIPYSAEKLHDDVKTIEAFLICKPVEYDQRRQDLETFVERLMWVEQETQGALDKILEFGRKVHPIDDLPQLKSSAEILHRSLSELSKCIAHYDRKLIKNMPPV